MYYTGHGCKNTGDWVAAKKPISYGHTISIDEIFEIIKKSNFNKNIVIVSDCCYSGNWPFRAKDLMQSSSTRIYSESIIVSSSSARDRQAQWGKYAAMKKASGDPDMDRAIRTKIIRDYYKHYGLVDYLSIKDKIIEKLPEEKIP